MATQAPPEAPAVLGKKRRELQYGRKYVWQVPIRLTHWTFALSIPILMITGLLIARPQLSPSGEAYRNFWMGRIREIHFITAYALTVAIALRAYWFFVGNNYARSGFPLFWRLDWWKAVLHQMVEYLHLERGHVHLGHNSLAGASYAGFLGMSCFEALTGFALFSEVNHGGFWDRMTGWIIPLLGGSYQTHFWHHAAAWGIVIFVLFHVYIVLYDAVLYKDGLVDAMFSGFKFYEKGDLDSDKWVS
ncbi:MAG TPA: Ni/Fe-hydrogenase, b-type cytochrome subunit [Bryobacteraceae bacterium]|jgi:Ni/Fe-hydrogenase 1 B-type cytochrome subunit